MPPRPRSPLLRALTPQLPEMLSALRRYVEQESPSASPDAIAALVSIIAADFAMLSPRHPLRTNSSTTAPPCKSISPPPAAGAASVAAYPAASVAVPPPAPASARPHRHRLPPRNSGNHALPTARRTPLRSRRIRHESRNRPGSLRPPRPARPRPAALPGHPPARPRRGNRQSRFATPHRAPRPPLQRRACPRTRCRSRRRLQNLAQGSGPLHSAHPGRPPTPDSTSSAAPRPSSRPPTRSSPSVGSPAPPRDSPSTPDSSPEACAPTWSPILLKLSSMCGSSPHPKPPAQMLEFINCARAIHGAASKFSEAWSVPPSSVRPQPSASTAWRPRPQPSSASSLPRLPSAVDRTAISPPPSAFRPSMVWVRLATEPMLPMNSL